MNNKDADQHVHLLRLVCAFVVHMQQSQIFSHRGPTDILPNSAAT